VAPGDPETAPAPADAPDAAETGRPAVPAVAVAVVPVDLEATDPGPAVADNNDSGIAYPAVAVVVLITPGTVVIVVVVVVILTEVLVVVPISDADRVHTTLFPGFRNADSHSLLAADRDGSLRVGIDLHGNLGSGSRCPLVHLIIIQIGVFGRAAYSAGELAGGHDGVAATEQHEEGQHPDQEHTPLPGEFAARCGLLP